MGMTAVPTLADRAAIRARAAAIVEAVTNDEPWPLGLMVYCTPHIGDVVSVKDVETLVMQLAQEIVLLTAPEKWAECCEPADGDGVPACGWTGEMGQLVDRGLGILHCPNCGSTAIKEDIDPS